MDKKLEEQLVTFCEENPSHAEEFEKILDKEVLIALVELFPQDKQEELWKVVNKAVEEKITRASEELGISLKELFKSKD